MSRQSPQSHFSRRFGHVLLLATLVAANAALADDGLEARVKAAFLYKFASYVEWPDSGQGDEAAFTVAVVDADAIASALQALSPNRRVGNRLLMVKRLQPGDSLAGAQMLFIGRSAAPTLKSWLDGARNQPILVITEQEGALAQGSVINFVLAQQHVRFEISLPAAEQRHLTISSRLLSVAQQVQTGNSP